MSMIRATRLIVLNTTKIKDNTIVLHCLSRDFGRRGFVVGTSRPALAALFQPLSIIDAEAVENPHSELWRLRSITAAFPLDGIRSDMHKNCITMFMSEVLYRTVHDGVMEEGLYEWCEREIITLNAIRGDFSNFHLRFLLEFAAALGFSPRNEDLLPFADGYAREIQALLQSDFASCMVLPLNGKKRCDIAERILKYLEYHTGARIDVRSLSVLREIYA